MIRLDKQNKSHDFNADELRRLLVSYDNKYILAIEARLWFPYNDADVTVNINLCSKDGSRIQTLDTFTGTPMPNKDILFARMKFGRINTRNFIPVVFDSFDALNAVAKIEIIWDIKNEEKNEREFVISEYDISFAIPVQNRCYAISTYDMTSYDICNKEKLKSNEIVLDLSENPEKSTDRLYFDHPSGSEYDDVYLMANREGQLVTICEAHAENSDYTIEKLDSDEKNFPNSVTNAILRCLTEELKTGKMCDVPIVFCHTETELDDERIIAL